MLIAGNVDGPTLERLRNGRCPTWLIGLFSLAILAGSGISALGQDTDRLAPNWPQRALGVSILSSFGLATPGTMATPLSCTAGSVSLSRKRASPAFLQ